eukprot:TRINITY_DN14344_c0_g1_i1.p1 TRINITY_DN14344_c0_g1~~TRINITY_DN14344_c0_g1_i1.p1  ORF type:complete len:121 (-),score=30.25 TRINITY_DN14344_c0_g1_i1:54-416(-)
MDVEEYEEERQNIKMFFCGECNNMMYPKEEFEDGEYTLAYFCKNNCKKEISNDWCVYRNDFKAKVKDDIPLDIVEDVTLQRIKHTCMACNKTNVDLVCVVPKSDDNMKPYLYCTLCRNMK